LYLTAYGSKIMMYYSNNLDGLYEELNDLYSSPTIVLVMKSRRMRWLGHVARMGDGRGVYRILVGKPEGKRPLGGTQA
jgi:hypothetical protein